MTGTYAKGDTVSLPPKTITQEMISRYADAADDHNPLHIDPEFAKTTRYGGTIAHGMLGMAFVQELMGNVFGLEWLTRGTIESSFLNPVRPGDTLSTLGKVTLVDEDTGKLVVQVVVSLVNDPERKIINAKCTLREP